MKDALVCRAFSAWADRTAHKKVMRGKLLEVSQLFMHGSKAQCFQAWHQEAEVNNAFALVIFRPSVSLQCIVTGVKTDFVHGKTPYSRLSSAYSQVFLIALFWL